MNDIEQVLNDAWRALALVETVGTHQRRLDPDLNINATITNPRKLPGVYLRVDEALHFEPAELAGSDQVELTFTTSDAGSSIQLTLREDSYRDMFHRLVADLVPRVVAQKSPVAAGTVLVRRFNAWQRFMKRSSGRGLSAERQLGLYGELKTLQQTLLPHLGVARALAAWTGPARQAQDYQLDGIAIEVKSIVHSEPQILKIDGERQLDDFGLSALVLAHHRVFRHKESGETLPSIVEVIREQINAQEGSVEDFDDLLLTAGYLDIDVDLYRDTGYSLKKTTYYRVQPGFPRLIETDLLPGVGGLRYSVTADACAPFEMNEDDLISWFTDPPPVLEPASTLESSQVEYKQTAWTPVAPTENQEHRAEVVRSLKTAVIKTVVAFMNSDGGELVIGVDDKSKQVTGVGPDLLEKGRPEDDLDAYEQFLTALFAEHIDRLAHAQLRVRFEQHATGTTCHVTVRRSPTPRFGYPPGKSKGGRPTPVFWVRALNTTVELEGADLVDHLREHHWR